MTETSMYLSGEYAERHETWHEEDSPTKAADILKILRRNSLTPRTIWDVGCGAGEIISILQAELPGSQAVGFDISPQAIARASRKAREGLEYRQGSPFDGAEIADLACAIDVFEHVEDYLGFLREMRRVSRRQVYHIPLDLSAQGVVRGAGIARARENLGHLHFFTRDTALASLEHTGHHISDWFYTVAGFDKASLRLKGKIAAAPRLLGQRIAPDLTAKLLGGYSIMALCE